MLPLFTWFVLYEGPVWYYYRTVPHPTPTTLPARPSRLTFTPTRPGPPHAYEILPTPPPWRPSLHHVLLKSPMVVRRHRFGFPCLSFLLVSSFHHFVFNFHSRGWHQGSRRHRQGSPRCPHTRLPQHQHGPSPRRRQGHSCWPVVREP